MGVPRYMVWWVRRAVTCYIHIGAQMLMGDGIAMGGARTAITQ